MDLASTIIAMERAALDRWGRGDPSGFLEISAEDVVYFDPFLDRRVDGLDALTRYYESIRGQVQIARYELLNPKVQVAGDAAVLTFNYVSWGETRTSFAGIARRSTGGMPQVGASCRRTGRSRTLVEPRTDRIRIPNPELGTPRSEPRTRNPALGTLHSEPRTEPEREHEPRSENREA